MARGFNLTAEINLRGPSNIRTVVADIRRQLGTVTADVNVRIDPGAARTVNALNQSLTRLNSTLQNTRTLSNQAVSALNSLASVGTRVNSSISSLPRNVQAAATAVNTLTRNTQASAQATQRARTEFEEFGRQSALAVRRFAAFALGTSAIVKLNNAIAGGVREFIAFDRELVRVSQVTGTSVKNLGSLVGQITSLSTSLGVTSEDLISVSSTLAQAGLSARDTEKALKALALSALAPSFDSLQDTVEGSIALMRQFGISAGDLEKALGSVNAVAAKFAVEAGDIITAIQRTGGVFAAASRGVSDGTDALNEFIAVFTSVRQTTRESAETIATGLRTIFTRIQRGDTIDALKQYGVVLTDLEGKFVGPYEAVRRLAEGLNQLDPRDLRFSRIVEELGGFRQIGKVIPLIQQFTTAQQALIVAQRGQGSLATDAAIAQQALANKISKVREEFVGLIRSVSQSQSFQNFVDLSLNLASALISIADAAKSVLPALTAITAIRGASFLTQFATGFYGGMRRSNAPRGMATGGMVPGQGNRDTVPAMLTPGEFVIRKRAVEKIGVGRLSRLNKSAGGPVQYLNSGGLVQNFAGGKTVKKSKKGKEELSSAGPTEFTHIAARLTPEYFSPQLQKYFKSKKLNVSGIYSNMGLDLPMNWNRNWDLPRDNKGAFSQTLANYIGSKDVFKTLKSGSNKRWRFTGRGDSIAQNLLVQFADQIRSQLSQRVRGRSNFFDIDGEVSSILPGLLRSSIKAVLPKIISLPGGETATPKDLISGFEEKSAYKVGSQRKSVTKQIRAQLKASGGGIQRFMAGQAVKAAKPAALTPQNLVIGPGYLKGGEWSSTLQSLISKNGLTADPGMRNLMVNGQRISLADAFSSRQLGSAKLRELVGADNIIKLEKLRADVASAYSGKRAGVVEANRPRTEEEVAAAQQKALLFGAAGMYGKRFPATEIVLGEADGLKQQTKATVFGALLDRNAAEREKRLQKRKIMLEGAGIAGGVDAGTTEITSAPTSKGLSKFFGYKASVTGVSKANKQLAMNTVSAIAKTLSPTTQGSQILLDFDRTLAFGSDKIGGKINKKAPDYSAFGDPRQVAGGLANAKLSGLGLRLRKLVSDLDLKSPGLGNELLKRMFVVSARPAQTMPLIARWLRNQGLRIPPGNVSGVGGPGLGPNGVAIAKAEKMLNMAGPGSVFIDDDPKNIAAAREKGISSIQYGSSTTKKAKRQAAQQEGLQFEQFISEQLPANLKTGIFGTDGEGIDFPFGLGSRISQYWFNDPRLSSIPVDTKRTLTGPRGKIKDNIISYLKGQGYNAGGMVQRFANAGPVEEYYGQREVEAARKSWRKFKSSVKKAFDSDKVYFDMPMAKSIAEGAEPEVYGTGIGKLGKGEPGVIGSKKIKLAKQKAAVATDPREAARRKAVRKQDELAAMALKGLLGGLPQDKQREVAALFGLSPGIGPSLMPSLGAGGIGASEELAAAKQGVSALKKTGSLNVSKKFVDFFRSSLASYYLELKQAAALDPSDPDIKKQLKKTRRAGVDVRRSLRTDEPIGVQGRRTAASETLSLMLKEKFQGLAKGGNVDGISSTRAKEAILGKQLNGVEMIRAARRAGYDIEELDNGLIQLSRNQKAMHTLNRAEASKLLGSMSTGYNLGGMIQKFARGGSVEDRVPALLTPGEFVINKKAAQRIGASRLHNLNRADRIQGFNKGGAVGYIQKLANGGEKLAQSVGSFDSVSKQAADALAKAMKTAITQEFKAIRLNNPRVSASDAIQQARANVQPTANFGLFRAAETGDQNAANMVADAQRKQVNSIIKQIRAADGNVSISQAKAAAERRVADAWGGLYKRTKEQEQQASLLSRAMARVSGLYGKIKRSDLTPEQRERKESRDATIRNIGMTMAFAGPMLADQVAQSMGGTKGAGLSAGVSAFSTYAAVGSQFGVIGTLIGSLVGLVAALDAFGQGVTKANIELEKTKIEKESQKSEKTLATLNKDPKNLAATQELIKSLDAMSTAEQNIQSGQADLRKPTMMGSLASFVTGGYYDSTTPQEVKNNKEYQDELKKLQERNLNATEFAAEKRELVAKFTAQEVGQANAAQSRARSEIAMQALAAKGSQGLTIDEALGSFGSNAGKIQESIAAGSQKYAVELEKLVQDAATSGMSSAELDKRKKSLVQKYFLEETETLRAAMADQARAKAANKVAKALNTAVTSIERTFGNMESALNRGADALSRASSSLDAMAADKSNLQNAFTGQNILENPRAYSRRERAGAVRQSSGFFGRDAGFVEKLTSTVGSDIKDSLTSIASRAQSTGASKEATAQEIQRSVDQQLTAAFGNNDLTRQLSEQIRIQLDTQLKNKDTEEIDLDQLLAASTGLTSLIESEKKAFELLASATKQVTQALDIYTSKVVTATEMLNEVDNINAESVSMRASNDFRLREMLGQGRRVPLGERLAARSQEAAARAGLKPTELNTQSLLARLGTLRQTRSDMEQRRAQFQEGRSFTDPATMQGIMRFNAGLINLDNQIAKTKNALKNLPKDIQGAIDDVAGAMEDRLSKIESKREAGGGFAERLVTSTPTELTNLSSTYNTLNNALNGQARTIQQSVSAQMAYQKVIQDGGTAVEAMTAAQSAYADENKQIFSLFNELVAVGGIDKQQANSMRADLLETMARSQGLNMQNNPLFNQVIANLRRPPEEDPEIKRLKTLYEQLQQTQQEAAEATRQLVIDDATALVKSAGDAVKTAIETARISFNEQQLADMGLGLSRPGQVMNKAEGGLIYASTGKLINFKPKGTDTVPAMLTPGEFVVNARATKQNLPLLQSINKSGGGPVQYFSAGTAKPVSMSRNASTPITTPAQARSFYDDIMNTWGVPAGGSITPNPSSKPAQAAAAPKPTTTASNTAGTTLASAKPAAPNIQTDPVGFINHYSDQFKGTPYYDESRKLLEQQVRAYDRMNASSARGDQRKAAGDAWKDFLQRARGGDGSVPTAPKPTVSSTAPPAAATASKPAADVAATPSKPVTAVVKKSGQGRWPGGVVPFSKEELDSLAKGFGITPEELLDRMEVGPSGTIRLGAKTNVAATLSKPITVSSTTPKPVADVAATPKPTTTTKPSRTTTKPSTATAPAPDPAYTRYRQSPQNTNFVYDPDNLIGDAPSVSATKDTIAKRGPLMDYDSIQPDAAGQMRTVGAKPSRGLFGGLRLPSLGRPSLRGAAGLGMRAASMGVRGAIGLTRSTASSMLPVMALNAASEMMGLGSLSNESATMTGIGLDSLMAGVRGAIPGRAMSSVPIQFPFGGTIRTLPQQAGRLTGYNALRSRLPNVGNSVLRGARLPNIPGVRLPSGAQRALQPIRGIINGTSAANTAGGLRGAAASAGGAAAGAVALNTAISGITEGVSFLYDREGYSNRLAAEEESEYANANAAGQSGLRQSLGQGLSGFSNPFRMFAKFGRAAYSTSQATADNQTQQKMSDARIAQQKQDWSMGGRMQMLEGNEGYFADPTRLDSWVSARAPVYLDTVTGKKYDTSKRSDDEAFNKIISGDRLAGFGLSGIERGWVQAKAELEENKGRISEEEYNKRNEDLIARRNATTTRYNRGYLWNTETKEKLLTSDNLDRAVESERAFKQQQREEAARKAEEQRMAEAQRQADQFMQWVGGAVQTGSDAVTGVQNLWNYGQRMWTTMQANAEAKREADNIKRMYNDASEAMAKPSMPDYIDKFKQLADKRRELEKEYLDAGRFVDPEVRKEERARLKREIEEINSTVIKQQREGYSSPPEDRKQAWDAHNKAIAAAEAKAQREAILSEKREINAAAKRNISAQRVLGLISRLPPPRDPERVPDWRAKSLKKIRDKFNLSGDPEKDIGLMTAYGMSPELAKGLFRPLTEDQNKAVYDVLSQQTQKGQYKYSDSDLQLLKMSRQQIMEKVNKGELKGSAADRKEILEKAREKEFGKALKSMGRIDLLAQRGMSVNQRAQLGFRERLLKKLIKEGYVDPRESDATNAQRLSSLNLNANTVSFVYPGQVGGMLAGKVDNAQQKSLGGVVYASTGKLINFKPRGSDTVPAMLTPGEFVVNAKATQQNLPLLQAINKADGGAIGNVQGTTASAKIREQQSSLINQKQTLSQIQNVAKETSKIDNTTKNINNQQLPNINSQATEFQKENFGILGGLTNTSNAIFKNTKWTAEALAPLNFNKGGMVYASTGMLIPYKPRGTDTVPAMLTPGEFVVNRSATKANLPLLQAINGGAKGFSNGGQVNYMADGGLLGQLFAPLLGSFKGLTSVVQLTVQALQTYQKQLAGTQPNSVSNTSGSRMNLDGLSEFTTKFDQFITALNSINIPPMVNLQVAPVTVNITGAEALVAALEGPLGGMLQTQIATAMNNLSANTEGAFRV